eukprot:scaffold100686_cov63-Phaeocystis_antarctica.AAC.1
MRSLVNGGEQRDAAQGPLLRHVLGAQQDARDKIQAGPPGRLVDGAIVVDVLVALARGGQTAGDPEHGQRREEDLRVRVGQPVLGLLPLRAVEVEAVDVDALVGALLDLVALEPEHLGAVDDVVERPAVLAVPSADLLPVGRQEAGGVEEARQPEGRRPAVAQPLSELVGAVEDVEPPHAHVGREQHGDLGPHGGHARHEEGVESLAQLGRHDDGAGDGELELREHEAHRADDLLQPVDLLLEADVERLAHAAQALDARAHVVRLVVGRHLGLQVVDHLQHRLLAREAAAAAALLGLDVEDDAEHLLRLQRAEGQVGVAVQPEDLGVVHEGQVLDVLAVLVDVRARPLGLARGHDVARVELEGRVEAQDREPGLAVGLEEPIVPVVGDAAAVLHVAHHVVDDDPVHGPLLGLHVVQVVVHELHAGREVGLVELVRDVEAERPELAPLLHDGVHEAERVEHRLPLRLRDGVEHVLAHPRVRTLEARAHARRRLVGDLDGHLQQADGELGVRLGRDPQAEGVDGVDEHEHVLLHLREEAEAQVAVLQQDPVARGHALVQQLARRRLLALPHGDGEHGLLALLGELDDGAGGVRPHGEQRDDGHLEARLVRGRAQVERARVAVAAAEAADDVVLHGEERAVLAHRAHHEQLLELVEPLLELGHLDGLGHVVVVPLLPGLLGVLAPDAVGQVAQHLHRAAHGDAVHPRALGQPLVRLGLLRLGVERAAALEQAADVGGGEAVGDALDLHREHEHPDELVLLVEAALHVARDVEGEVLDDVDDALRGERRLLGVVDGEVEELEELLQRDHVHVVDRRHVDDQEVEQRAARRHGPVLLARDVHALVRLGRVDELLLHLDARGLGVLQHLDELDVVEQVARRVGEAVEQVVLERLEQLLVGVDVLDELHLLLLQLGPLLAQHAAEQLLLEAGHGHGEVDHGELREDLGRVVRVGELRGEEEVEGLAVLALLVRELDDDVAAALALDLLVEHRVEHRVDLLLDVLNEQRRAEGHRVLERVTESLLEQVGHLELVLLLAALDPAQALRLR